ncbi:MAG: peptide chain release factor N(5)-glutamine methyltransferase [Bacilli bacterium]|nr:peptide chain release factor N(5)-glutamine methyltransferase [Bacilli bacterium]
MRIADIYTEGINKGKEFGVLSADLRVLLAHNEGFAEPIDVLLRRDEEVKKPDLFWEQFEELRKGKPVEYIVNEASFLNRKLYVDERVLIPRTETEELVATITERITDYYDPRNYLVVADIGTGSGAIAIALKSYFRNWILLASDISEGALEVANKNISKGVATITTMQGDALTPYIEKKINLDIIVSNPPYITNPDETQDSVKDYEPSTALWLDKNNSVYEKIFRDCYKVKKEGLLMCFEIGYDLEEYLTELMAKYLHDYEFEFLEDLNGKKRFLFVYLQ